MQERALRLQLAEKEYLLIVVKLTDGQLVYYRWLLKLPSEAIVTARPQYHVQIIT